MNSVLYILLNINSVRFMCIWNRGFTAVLFGILYIQHKQAYFCIHIFECIHMSCICIHLEYTVNIAVLAFTSRIARPYSGFI